MPNWRRADQAIRVTPDGNQSPAAIELVIFDCDGVLVDSERLAVRIEASLITSLGWAISPEEVVERFVGRSDAFMHSEIEAALGVRLPGWPNLYRRHLHESFRSELRPVDGIVEVLDELQIPSCIASSGTHEKLRLTLGITGILDRFAGRIFSVDDVERGKPAPDLFLHAASSMATHPSRCLVVEDSRFGVEAARSAGMRSVGFAGGVTPARALEGPGTTIVTHMSGLGDLIRSMSVGHTECSRDS